MYSDSFITNLFRFSTLRYPLYMCYKPIKMYMYVIGFETGNTGIPYTYKMFKYVLV